jgi:hypothetical protein
VQIRLNNRVLLTQRQEIKHEQNTTQKPSVRFREGVLQKQSYTRQGSIFAPKPDHLPSDDQIRNK